MSDNNITEFPHRDLIAEMKGPENVGNCVRVNGREIPKLAMFDHGDEIEFILDHRVSYGFPRAQAWDAAAFALAAMAVGAGCDPLNFEPSPFAKKVVDFGTINSPETKR
jgi:hypothetical protein